MFDGMKRALRDLGRQPMSVSFETDDEGYVDRQCPFKDCLFVFKVHIDDWKNLFKNEAIFCPLCRHKADSSQWWTYEQIAYAKKFAENQVLRALHKGARSSANSFAPSRKKGFITITLSLKGSPPAPMRLPAPATEEMKMKVVCEKCNARFSVIGAAYFCPCCGYNSVVRVFEASMQKVLAKVENLELVKTAFAEAGKEDEGVVCCQSLIETGIQDCVVAFQYLAEKLYLKIPGASTPPFNVFQRIDDGSDLWKHSTTEGYDDWLTEYELKTMKLLFQRRHLFSHTEGIVDEKYLNKSGDVDYVEEQRIVVKERDVVSLVHIVSKLAEKMKKHVP